MVSKELWLIDGFLPCRQVIMDINDLEKIVKILKDNDVQEFELEQEGTHIRLSRSRTAGQEFAVVHAPIHSVEAGTTSASSAEAVVSKGLSQNFVAVESPIVGTFYQRPTPDAEPFVREGQVVKKGTKLCIIEAMKVMNEIESSCDGKIVRILPQDGQVVEYGEELFLIDPAG